MYALTLVTPDSSTPLVPGLSAHERNQELIHSITINISAYYMVDRAGVRAIEIAKVVQDSASPLGLGNDEFLVDG